MDFQLPTIGEGVYEAELVRWLVEPGDRVKPGQTLVEVMTDKATMEVPAPFAGTVSRLLAEPGQMLQIGQPLLEYTSATSLVPAGDPVKERAPSRNTNGLPAARTSSPTVPNPTPLSVRAAPSVRQLARKLGIDLTTVTGSGPEGRVLLDDLTSQVRTPTVEVAPTTAPEPRPAARTDLGTPGTRVKLQGLRRRIAERMVEATQAIPHYSYIDEADVTELVKLRDGVKDVYARAGVKLTYLAFFVKAVVAALKEIPIVNASLESKTDEIVFHAHYNVGIAVATPGGLVVPVIRDADRKDLGTVARDIERLSAEARAGRSRLEDLKGGTFTITSVGNIGGLISTPILNPPEVGILGLGKVVRRPVYDDMGAIRPAEMVYLSFSFDHRVVDGAVGAMFGNTVLRHLHTPARLLLPARLSGDGEARG